MLGLRCLIKMSTFLTKISYVLTVLTNLRMFWLSRPCLVCFDFLDPTKEVFKFVQSSSNIFSFSWPKCSIFHYYLSQHFWMFFLWICIEFSDKKYQVIICLDFLDKEQNFQSLFDLSQTCFNRRDLQTSKSVSAIHIIIGQLIIPALYCKTNPSVWFKKIRILKN